MSNQELITKFYTSFSNGDVDEMVACYHPNVVFEDPAFGKLQGNKAKAMWQMLLSKKKESELTISFEIINETEASWIANYKYGPKRRSVINNVHATFEFKEGLISKHTDYFNLWKWSQQALGLSGFLLGWSSFMKAKIQATTNQLLLKYTSKQH